MATCEPSVVWKSLDVQEIPPSAYELDDPEERKHIYKVRVRVRSRDMVGVKVGSTA